MLPLFCLAACVTAPSGPWQAAAAPAADALFHRDPAWRGGDAAYSIDLGSTRTLWLFGDSFVARPGANGRADCAMVRNSIAVQRGADPVTAAMTFHWRGTAAAPQSFLPADGAVFLWPLSGLRTADCVTVFCTRVRDTPGEGLGFRAVGWAALCLHGVDAAPEQWQVEVLPVPVVPFAAVVGTAVIADGDHVYAYALREPGDHAVFLLRWPRARFTAGELGAPEWFDRGRFVPHAELRAAPTPVLAEGAPEFSVHRDGDSFVMAQSLGFGHTTLALRRAPRPEGPWSAPEVVFIPPESQRQGVFVYAGKAHPQLTGNGQLLLTYASNAADFGQLVADPSLYFPRFVRLRR